MTDPVSKLPVPELTWDQRVVKGIDAFINTATGAGTAADKFTYSQFQYGTELSPKVLEALYTEHDLAATIVERIVHDALRSGYEINWKGASDSDRSKAVAWAESTYHVTEETKQARVWSRLFGGGGVFVGVTGSLESPAFLGSEVNFLRAVPSTRLEGYLFYDDIADQRYAQVQEYRHKQLQFNQAQDIEPYVQLHESRIVPFYGVRTTDEQMIRDSGWGKSVLHRVYDVLLKFDQSFDSTLHTLLEMSVPVYKVRALLDLLASENGELLAKRFELINTAKSQYKAVILDMEEVFERVEARLSEANAIVEAAMLRVSAAAGIPQVLLFGRSASGQNATGASDLENWNQQVRSEQALTLGPAIQAIYEWLLAQPESPVKAKVEDLTVDFPAVETPSIQEQANLYQQIANADTQYEAMGAVSAAEIAIKRSLSSPLFPGVDMAHLRELDDLRKEQLINPPEPMEMEPDGEEEADDDAAAET